MELVFYYLAEGGGKALFAFFFLIGLYIVWKGAVLLRDRLVYKKQAPEPIKALGWGVLELVIFFGGVFVVLGYLLVWVNSAAQPEVVLRNSAILMELDQALFGSYVPFWVQAIGSPVRGVISLLSPLIIEVYQNLVLATSLVFTVALIRSQHLFREVFLAFILSILVCLPFWYLVPALTPLDAYWKGRVSAPYYSETSVAMANYQPSSALAAVIGERALMPQPVPLVVTTFPSLHVALSVVVLIYGALLWLPLLWVLVPYFLLNAIATVVLLQHYAVDVPAGILVGLVAVGLARLVGRRWKTSNSMNMSDMIRADLTQLGVIWKGMFRRSHMRK